MALPGGLSVYTHSWGKTDRYVGWLSKWKDKVGKKITGCNVYQTSRVDYLTLYDYLTPYKIYKCIINRTPTLEGKRGSVVSSSTCRQ